MSTANCIYCSTPFDPTRGDGDHIIPAALGEFRNDRHFRGLCPKCNNHIGKSEQVLLHCGPEAFFRRVVNPALPTSRQRGRSPVGMAMGARGISQTIDVGDHRMLVEMSPDDPLYVKGVDQLVIHDSTDAEHFFRLFPNMKAARLKARIDRVTAPPPYPQLWLHCDLRHGEEYERLIRQMWPRGDQQRLPDTPVGTVRADGQVHLTVNSHYWRALAKIGFHYYLCHSQRNMRGNEDCFAAIRDFIINGGDKDQFFRKTQNEFALPFGELPEGGVVSPDQWCHILGADESEQNITAYVHLFVGRACIPTAYHIVLGMLGTNIIGPPSFTQGHVYLYDREQNTSGTAGRVEKASVTKYPKGHAPVLRLVEVPQA